MRASILCLGVYLIVSGCSLRWLSKDLRTQRVPDDLAGKKWKLVNVVSNDEYQKDNVARFNSANGTDNCSFTIWFENHGRLHVKFIDTDLGANYILKGNKFEVFFFWKMQWVWGGDEECPLNPERLNWTKDHFEYKVVGNTLILENPTTGNKWTLIQL